MCTNDDNNSNKNRILVLKDLLKLVVVGEEGKNFFRFLPPGFPELSIPGFRVLSWW